MRNERRIDVGWAASFPRWDTWSAVDPEDGNDAIPRGNPIISHSTKPHNKTYICNITCQQQSPLASCAIYPPRDPGSPSPGGTKQRRSPTSTCQQSIPSLLFGIVGQGSRHDPLELHDQIVGRLLWRLSAFHVIPRKQHSLGDEGNHLILHACLHHDNQATQLPLARPPPQQQTRRSKQLGIPVENANALRQREHRR